MKTIFLAFISLMLLGSGLAYAEVNYTTSAHGNSSSGVNRFSATEDANFNPAADGYAKGNCAHCHEQHASVDGTEPAPSSGTTPPTASNFCLFANNFSGKAANAYIQSDNFCFYCHTDSVITNENYAATFGGASATVSGIMQAFNSTSYHNLKDVIDYADSVGAWPFTADSNPCSACHNVHIAKRNKATPGDPTYTAISKPSVHDSLWGDDTNERMTVYGGETLPHYQPPYDADDTNFEPDGATAVRATQALKTPDYNAFCLDCHQYEVPSSRVSVNTSTTSGYLTAIDWSSEKHGQGAADTYISVDAPYTAGTGVGYVLSCLDCHEPHGSPNVFLIRTEVNGGAVGSGTFTTTSSLDCDPADKYTDNADDWKNLCNRCHEEELNNYERIHHLSSDYPYEPDQCSNCHEGGGGQDAINCSCCHYHGSSAAGRVTF